MNARPFWVGAKLLDKTTQDVCTACASGWPGYGVLQHVSSAARPSLQMPSPAPLYRCYLPHFVLLLLCLSFAGMPRP